MVDGVADCYSTKAEGKKKEERGGVCSKARHVENS